MAVLRRYGFVAAVLAAACGTADSGTGSLLTSDSAGVTIVESSAPLCAPGALHIDPVASLSIGALDGDPNLLFTRIASLSVRSDGATLLAETQADEIRVFDAQGGYLFTAGAKGEGPGEFFDVYGAWAYRGDSILAFDRWVNEVEIFDPEGNPVRSFRVEAPMDHQAFFYAGDVPHVLGAWSDGSIIAETQYAAPRDAPAGPAVRTTTLLRYPGDGMAVDTVGTFVVQPVVMGVSPQGRFAAMSPLFALNARPVLDEDGIVIQGQDVFELRSYDANGTLRRIARRAFDPVPVESRHTEEYLERSIANAPPDMQASMRRAFESAPVASHFPVISRVRIGQDGMIWAQHYALPGVDTDAWSAFGPQGRWLGEVTMPPGLIPYVFSSDYVLGIWRDEATDVPYVRRHALIRDAGCGVDVG